MTEFDSNNESMRQEIESLLVDLHLDQISDDDRLKVERAIENDPQLGKLSDSIGRRLRPLDYWSATAMPENLIDRTMAHIQATTNNTTQDAPAITSSLNDPEKSQSYGPSIPLPLKEALAVAACIGLLVSAMIPSLAEIRHRSQQSQCALNLGSMFQGTRTYQASFGGMLPFAGGKDNSSWLPSASGATFASNSRNIYLLAKHNFGPRPDEFVCPSSEDAAPMEASILAEHDDFMRKANISYDTLNLAGANPRLNPTGTMVYAGDANPLFSSGRFDNSLDPNNANSSSHNSRGQNVLTLDGKVQWTTSPVYGTQRDNIWLVGDIKDYNGTERPQDDTDAHLVPGFPTTDPDFQSLQSR